MTDEAKDGIPDVSELTAEESVAFIAQQVQSLDDVGEKAVGSKVLDLVQGMLSQAGGKKLKASPARYRLETFLYPGEANRIAHTIQTIIWINGETMGPGGDQLIHECPRQGCNGLHEPPIKWFTRPGVTEWVRNEKKELVETPVALVACPNCLHVYPRRSLTDSRWCTGTWDVLGAHVAKRFMQLHCDADFLLRISEGRPRPAAMEVIDGQRGAVDNYIRQQQKQQKGAYKRLELIMVESLGRDLPKYFQSLLQG